MYLMTAFSFNFLNLLIDASDAFKILLVVISTYFHKPILQVLSEMPKNCVQFLLFMYVTTSNYHIYLFKTEQF